MNSHWSIKSFKSEHLLTEIVESAISFFDQFFTIKSFEKIIFSLILSNRNLSFCSDTCTVKSFWFDHFYWDRRIKNLSFCQLNTFCSSNSRIIRSFSSEDRRICKSNFVFILIMIEASFFRSSKMSFRVSSSQQHSQESRASSSIESKTSFSILLKRIRRNDVDVKIINLYVA
jgi:hypothetical protein